MHIVSPDTISEQIFGLYTLVLFIPSRNSFLGVHFNRVSDMLPLLRAQTGKCCTCQAFMFIPAILILVLDIVGLQYGLCQLKMMKLQPRNICDPRLGKAGSPYAVGPFVMLPRSHLQKYANEEFVSDARMHLGSEKLKI